MSIFKQRILEGVVVLFCIVGYVASCTHDDEVLISQGPDITRGTQKVSLTAAGTSFDKAHSNVNWSTAYLGATSRYLQDALTISVFTVLNLMSNAANIHFEAGFG
jgi:hypothetical protein